jgi:DNA-binding transcriptional LysR family regulator
VFVVRPGHPLAGRPGLRLGAVLAYPLVGPRLPPRVGANLARASRYPLVDDIGDYVPTLEVDGVAVARQMVAASDGVAALPRPLVAPALADGSLVALDFAAPWLRTNYGFARPRDRPLSPPAEAFMAEVRAVEAEVAASGRA